MTGIRGVPAPHRHGYASTCLISLGPLNPGESFMIFPLLLTMRWTHTRHTVMVHWSRGLSTEGLILELSLGTVPGGSTVTVGCSHPVPSTARILV